MRPWEDFIYHTSKYNPFFLLQSHTIGHHITIQKNNYANDVQTLTRFKEKKSSLFLFLGRAHHVGSSCPNVIIWITRQVSTHMNIQL